MFRWTRFTLVGLMGIGNKEDTILWDYIGRCRWSCFWKTVDDGVVLYVLVIEEITKSCANAKTITARSFDSKITFRNLSESFVKFKCFFFFGYFWLNKERVSWIQKVSFKAFTQKNSPLDTPYLGLFGIKNWEKKAKSICIMV